MHGVQDMINQNSRVLIVDDFETVRLFLRNALSQIGIDNVEEATNGREALEALEQAHQAGHAFDIVFCDWNMPEMTGYELLNEVRHTAHLQHVPFVMVTAESEDSNVEIALKAGATDYITKPFTVDGLKSKIESIVTRLKKAS